MILLDAAIKFFGITEIYTEAGYICPDGRMLDFSGRHLKIGLPNSSFKNGIKSLIHSNFIGINKEGFSLTKEFPKIMTDGVCVGSFCKKTGCCRIGSEGNYISFIDYLTKEQLERIYKIFLGKNLNIERTDINCNILKEWHFHDLSYGDIETINIPIG